MTWTLNLGAPNQNPQTQQLLSRGVPHSSSSTRRNTLLAQSPAACDMLTLLINRVARSASTFPTADEIKQVLTGAVLMWGFLAATAKAGMYRWQPIKSAYALGWAATYITFRAVLEEVVFRAALLPHPKVDGADFKDPRKYIIHCLIPLALFVPWHCISTQRPAGQVLKDTRFLATAALVGVACSWAYWVSGGGLWAGVTMHILAVYPWMVLLGGHRKLHTPLDKPRAAGARELAPGGVESKAD